MPIGVGWNYLSHGFSITWVPQDTVGYQWIPFAVAVLNIESIMRFTRQSAINTNPAVVSGGIPAGFALYLNPTSHAIAAGPPSSSAM
jgi:hypothetical protein